MELSPLAISAIGGNALALMLTLVCYFSCFHRFHRGVRTSRCIFLMLVITGLATISETLSSLFDGRPGIGIHILLYITNSFNFCASLSVLLLWVLFFLSYFSQKPSRLHILITHVPMAIGIALIFLNGFFPMFFYINESNSYVRSYGYYVLLVFELIAAASSVAYNFANRKHIEPFKTLSTGLFLAPIFVGCIIQAFIYGLSLEWPSIAIGVAGLILSIQNQSIYRDSLTGLYNRAYLSYLQGNLLMRKTTSTVIMVDINDFKSINDECGHQIGDKALIEAGHIFLSVIGKKGSVVRYAGDEFLIIIRSDDPNTGAEYMAKIHDAFSSQKKTAEHPYLLSVSMGSVQCKLTTPESLDSFMAQIDKRMYESKKRYHETHHLSSSYE